MKKLVLITLISISSNVYTMQEEISVLALTQQLCCEDDLNILSDPVRHLNNLLNANHASREETTPKGNTPLHVVLRDVTKENASSRALLATILFGRTWGFEKNSEDDNSKLLFIANNDSITPLDQLHTLAQNLPAFCRLLLDIPSWTNYDLIITVHAGIPTITFDKLPSTSDRQFTFTEKHATEGAVPLFPTGLPLALVAAAQQKLHAAQKVFLGKIIW